MIEMTFGLTPLIDAGSPSGLLILTMLLTPAVGAISLLVIRGKRAIELVTLVCAGLVAIDALALVSDVLAENHASAFGQIFYLDSFGALVLMPIAGIGFVSALYSISYMSKQYERGMIDDRQLRRYYQALNVFVFTMLLVPVSNNLGIVWVAIEATTLVSVLLIMLYTKEGAIEASWKYLVIATVGLSFALFGIVFFYYANSAVTANADSAMNWTDMALNAKALDPNIVRIAFVFVLIGFGTKAGLAPMHSWLPDAHSEAPTPVSALLSGVLLNCAIYVILRFHIVSMGSLGQSFSSLLLIVLGIVSVAIAAASIYFQKDMKRMLAYSSIEHMGIISVAMGFGGFLGIYGGLLHIINHSLAKPLMFFASGTASQRYGTKAMANIRGVIQTAPALGVLLLIGGLAIAGMPPFNIFVSEFLILTSGFASGQFLASSVLIALLVLIFAGFMLHIIRMVFGKPAGSLKASPTESIEESRSGSKSYMLAILPMAILAVFIVVFGFYVPQQIHTLAVNVSQIFNQTSALPSPTAFGGPK
jgi:hydrogenase-4 component F